MGRSSLTCSCSHHPGHLDLLARLGPTDPLPRLGCGQGWPHRCSGHPRSRRRCVARLWTCGARSTDRLLVVSQASSLTRPRRSSRLARRTKVSSASSCLTSTRLITFRCFLSHRPRGHHGHLPRAWLLPSDWQSPLESLLTSPRSPPIRLGRRSVTRSPAPSGHRSCPRSSRRALATRRSQLPSTPIRLRLSPRTRWGRSRGRPSSLHTVLSSHLSLRLSRLALNRFLSLSRPHLAEQTQRLLCITGICLAVPLVLCAVLVRDVRMGDGQNAAEPEEVAKNEAR